MADFSDRLAAEHCILSSEIGDCDPGARTPVRLGVIGDSTGMKGGDSSVWLAM